MRYRPNRHYWIIGGSATEVYFSGTNTMVPQSDPAYQAWLVAPTRPAPAGIDAGPENIVTEAADIEAVRAALAPIGLFPEWLMNTQPTFIQPAVGAYTKPQLASYSAVARAARAGGGVTVTSISAIPFISDPVARNTLANALEYIKETPGSTVNWKMSNGTFIVLDEAKLNKAVTAVASFVQACFTCESTTLTNINGGSITTLPQIDAAYAAISNVYP